MRVRGVVEELSGTFAGARAVLSNLLDLFSLEARRAGLGLALMLACGVIGGVLAVAAWLGLMAALVLWAARLGAPWEGALAAAALANLALAGTLGWFCVRTSRALLFTSTRRQLRPGRLKVV